MAKGMVTVQVSELEGWGLMWALAFHAGDKKIIPVGSNQFGYLTGELVTVKKGENGKPDSKAPGVHIYTPDDHRRLLATFDLEPVEKDDRFVHEVVGVGEIRGDDRSEVKAKAVIAERVQSLELDIPI